MSNGIEMWVVEFKQFNDNSWQQVNNIKYTCKSNALAMLGKQIAADPEYSHRLVKLVKHVEVTVEGTGDYDE